MGQLQYISTTNGAFNLVLAQNVTQDSVIECKFLSTDYSNIVLFGEDYADVKVRHWWGDDDMYWYNGGGFVVTSLWTLNEEHTVSLSTSEYKWNGVKVYDVSGTCIIPSTPYFKPEVKGRIYYFKITTNDVVTVNLVAWEENGVVGLKDLVSGTFYQPSSGTWIAGPPVQDDSNVVPINKYKLYTSNVNKTYEGTDEINKMYVGSDLVYNKVVIPPNITYVDYIYTTENTYTSSFINTGIYPTINTKFRVKFRAIDTDGGAFVGFGPSGTTPTGSSSDSNDYRFFFNDITSVNTQLLFDFNSSRINKRVTTPQNNYWDLTFGNYYIYNNITESTIVTGSTQHSLSTQGVPIYVHIINDYEQLNQLTIYEETNGTDVVVFDGHAALVNGEYGLYDTVSQNLFQPTDGSTVYGGTWQ